MTEDLIVPQQEQPMRIINTDIGPVIPVIDIADMIGYSRSAITKAIKGCEGRMSPCKTFLPLQTSGGLQQCLCLNRTGVDYLLVLIHPSKTRMSPDDLLDFRRNILTKMSDGKKEIAQIPQKADIRTELLQAKEYAEVCGHDAGLFQAAVFKKHGLMEFAEALKVPSLIHGETGWYIPTQLGEMCALTASQLNHWLNNKGFQYREQGVWRLQPAGEMHGQEYWFEAPSGHKEIRIRWRESILYASGLKRELPASQLMLPARA